MPACGSPQLFAAYHVLLRQSVPRHPPCALIRLIYVLDLCFKHLIGFPHCLGACKIFILESYKRNVLIILCAVFKERFSGTTPENGIVSGRDSELQIPYLFVSVTEFPQRSTWDRDKLLYHGSP